MNLLDTVRSNKTQIEMKDLSHTAVASKGPQGKGLSEKKNLMNSLMNAFRETYLGGLR